jgi:hypothetical protein
MLLLLTLKRQDYLPKIILEADFYGLDTGPEPKKLTVINSYGSATLPPTHPPPTYPPTSPSSPYSSLHI